MRIARSFLATGFRCVALLLLTMPAFAQAPAGGTLAQVRARGAINFGYFPNARPVSFRDASGNADGYAIALCKAVADAVKTQLGTPGLAVNFVPLADADVVRDVQAGKLDVVCAPVQQTLARRAAVSFSLPVFLGGTSVLVRRDAPQAFRDLIERGSTDEKPLWRGSPQLQLLAKRDFAVVAGTASERWVRARAKELHVNSTVTTVPTLAAGLERVRKGESAGFLADRSLLLDMARTDNDVMVLDRLVAPTTYALVVRRDDDAFRLLVDRALSGLYRSGKIDDLYVRSFGGERELVREWFRWVALPDG